MKQSKILFLFLLMLEGIHCGIMQFRIWVAGIPKQLSSLLFDLEFRYSVLFSFDTVKKKISSQVRNKMSKLKKFSIMD